MATATRAAGPNDRPGPIGPAASGPERPRQSGRPHRRRYFERTSSLPFSNDLVRRLAGTSVFAGCGRRQLRAIARWGDVIVVKPGELVLRENRRDPWFFVVLSGSVRLVRQGKPVVTVSRGGHFGEVAIVGFAPQPATAVVAERSVLFVLGARYLLSLADLQRHVRRALFPELAASDNYRALKERLFAEGQKEWRRLAPTYVHEGPATHLRPGRSISWREARKLLVSDDLRQPETSGSLQPRSSRPLSRRQKVALIVTALVASVSGALWYHPPVAVVAAGDPVDVVDDITIAGVPSERPSGRYLMTWIEVKRPSLLGAAMAFARGEHTVSSHRFETPGVDRRTAEQLARQAFVDGQRRAVSVAAATLGLDPSAIKVTIRDHDLTGPSAGLVYALAIIDMIDPADLAADRVVAATGELQDDGDVRAVGFIAIKADGVRRGRAAIFVVPAGQEAEAEKSRATVVSARSLKEALRLLQEG